MIVERAVGVAVRIGLAARGGFHRAAGRGAHRAPGRNRLLSRWVSASAVTAVVAGALVASGQTADATQATGHDAVLWSTGWSWTYATTFNYNDGNGTNVSINENVTYTNSGPTTFDGESVYRLNLSGTITGGGGTANAGGTTANLSNFSGSVSGYEYIRRADLALMQEYQHQDLHGTAKVSIFSTGISATIDLTLTPSPGWRALDFPLNAGDHWQESEDIAYSGGFSYDAGSIGGSGSSPFNGTFAFDAPATVSAQTINPGIGSIATDYVAASSSDGSTVDNQWWSPQYENVAKEHLVAPLDGATLTLDRNLSSASLTAPTTTLTETITPSLSCAGGAVTVSGRLSSGASGAALAVSLTQQGLPAAQRQSVNITTGANGNYSTTLIAPWAGDGLGKNGSRGNWGVLVDGGGAGAVATLVVTPQDCTTLAYTGDTSAPQGGSATVSATLGDVASPGSRAGRSVSFSLSGGATVTATTNASGVATATLPVNGPPRSATVTASFAGNGTQTAASDSAAFVVATDPTTTAVVADPASVTIGHPVTFTATVTPGIGSGPTGTVQFVVDGHNFGLGFPLSSGAATSAPLSSLGLGTHTVVAQYSGDGNFAPSTSPTVTFVVHNPLLATTTALTVDPATAVSGQGVTATASVAPASGSGTPTGSVTFSDGATPLGTVALSGGTASLALPPLAVGSHTVTATYSGDDTYDTSSDDAPLTVNRADSSVAVVSTPDTTSVTGEAVSFTATVTPVAPGAGTPTGTATLHIDGATVGDPVSLVDGVAVFPPVSTLPAGAHTVTVSYSGDDEFGGSSGSLTQNVDPAATATALTVAPSPGVEDQPVTITATVSAQAPGSGTPTGLVTFTADGAPIGAATLAAAGGTAQASIAVSTLSVGDHQIVATYPGDPNYTGSVSGPVTETILAAAAQVGTTTALASSINPSTYGQLISFTATVTAADGSAPQGTVQFSVDGTDIGTAVPVGADGTATSVTLASPEPGDHTVIAAFQPAPGYTASGAFLTQTVSDATVHTDLASSTDPAAYGQPVTFTATVASTVLGTAPPTGVVQFRVDGTPLGGAVTLSADGTASSPAISTLTPGAHSVTALYSGDVHFLPQQVSLTQDVQRVATVTTLSASSTTPTYGDAVTFTATVTPSSTALGAPGGTVTFSDGTTMLGAVAVAGSGTTGTAQLTVSTLHGGSHAITASYSGSATFAPSTSDPLTVDVQRAATSLYARPALVRLLPLGLPVGMLRGELSTATGQPLAGMPLTFSIAGHTVCSTYTDADGHADCNARAELLQLTLALGYDVAFPGTADYLPSTAHGAIIN
jgi:hypothetical protein